MTHVSAILTVIALTRVITRTAIAAFLPLSTIILVLHYVLH